MTSIITLPELVEHDVDLEQRRTLGGPQGTQRIPHRVTIGRSEAQPLLQNHPDVDADLAALFSGPTSRHGFYVIHLSCSFRPGNDPLVSAVFSVALDRTDGATEPAPEVWSMDPLKLTTPIKYVRTRSLTPKLKIVPQVIDVDAAQGSQVEYSAEHYYVVASGEGEPTAEWYFRATPAVELVGIHHLSLIVRTPGSIGTKARIALQAKIRRRLGGLIQYNAKLPPGHREILIPAREAQHTPPAPAPDT
ncbi:MAG: hypothetical protein M3460_21310 [Actinomycetota bacterium]|nr:hypothetical protein [Actinomycetota bacterium]